MKNLPEYLFEHSNQLQHEVLPLQKECKLLVCCYLALIVVDQKK